MTTKKKRTTSPPPQTMGTGAVKDIVTHIVRQAISEQAREIEASLNDIDRRLRALEQ
jgi:hypothetical protein